MLLSRISGDPTVGGLRGEKENVLRGAGYAWTPIL